MSTNLSFPLSDFYEALNSKNVKQKLQPFIAQFRKKNIYIIYQCVNKLIQVIQNKSQSPLMKFNSLMAVRYFFDTCEYAAVIFIEIYMLPVIYEIALEKYLKRSEQGMELYFVDRGAQNTKQMRRLGLNYVQLAAEFIFNCAKVKPYRLIQNRQLKQESNFKRTVKVLNNKGINEQQKCIYYIPSYPAQTRKKFLKKLKHISAQPYISFVISNYLQEINLNKKCDLDIKKLLLHGDSFLTSTMVEIIQEELSKMSQNFINKKKYLNLLNDLIRSGEIQSIYLVNTSDFIRQIGQQIKKVKGNLGFTQGQYIYPMVQASKQDKKDFYIDFLRMLQIWAYCMPSTDQGEQSDVLRIYQELKKRNFVFPKNMLLKKIKEEMDQNLSLNQERNETLMKIIDEDQRVSQRNNGSYVSSKGEFKFHFPQYRQKLSYIELDQLHYKVYETKKRIARLSLDKQQLTQNMKFIKDFVQSWDQELQKLDIQDEDPHQLQMLVDQGDLCGQQYKLIKPFYELYVNKRVTFQQFAQKIQFLQHPDENSVNRSSSMRNSLYNRQQDSQISLEQRLQNTKYSKASQFIRKNIQNQYSNQYGYEKYEAQQKYQQQKYQQQKRSLKKSSKIAQNEKQNSQTSKQKFSSQSESNNQSRVSSDNQLSVNKSSQIKSSKLSQSKKSQSIKRAIDLGYSKKLNEDNYQNQRSQKQSQRKSKNSYAKSSKNSYNLRQQQQKQQSQKQQTSKVSSFQQESQSQLQSQSQKQKQSFKPPPKKVVHFKTERQRSPLTSNNPMSSLNGLKTQSNQKQSQSQKMIQEKYTSKKKSVIKHSVISKSSYHSQPHQAQMIDSGYNEGNSVMNDYEIENVPVQVINQNGINLKKSSIKRTQSSAMRNSSHKRLLESQHNLSKSQKKSSHQITEAVSPFKKKKQPQSKDIKIKESFIKDYEFVRGKNQSQQKRTHIKIDDNFTYEDAFRRRDQNQRDYHNDSQISSQSESVVERRNNKFRQKQVIKQIVKINLNDLSEYYAQETSILKKSNNNMKTATKNLILFDSNHSNNQQPLKQSKSANKYHEDYQIVQDQGNNKITKLTDKISEMSKNTSKFAHSKGKSSGIKLISRNDNKSFDKLYKNDYGDDMFGQKNGQRNRDQGSKRRYDQVNYEFNNDINLANSSQSPFKTQNKKFVINEKMRQSQHDSNKNLNNKNITSDNMISSQHTSMQYEHQNIDYEFQNFKANMIKKRIHNQEQSQINEPQNQPMLYSYCSDKSIHSRLTDSHTRRGNNRSSNNQQFKTCFMNMDKEVLPLTGAKTKIVSNSFSSLDKAFNFIDYKGSNAKSSSKVHSMADAISEKNAKNSILLYKLQRQKTRLVQNLQHKIKELQVNGKMMKTKYALKDQSIRENLSSRNLSQPQLKLNTKIVKTSRQSTQQNNNSIVYNNHELSNRLGSNMNAMTSRSNDKLHSNKHQQLQQKMANIFGSNSPQKVINTKQYNKFFQQYKQHSYKKTLHKKKGLFIKNDQIEIGYMINKKDKYLVMNVFVTPYAGSIKNVKTEVVVDNNIAVRHKQAKIDLIEVKKQEVISVSFYVQNLPYNLPLIKISFDSNRAYSANTFMIGLPATIVHFSEMLQSTEQDEGNQQKDSINKSFIMKTEIFKCSKKLNKAQKLIQAFSAMKQIKKDKKLTVLQCAMTYQDNINNKILLSIVMNESTGQAVIYGRCGQLKQKNVMKYLQYLLATMQLVLEEE